MKCIASFLVLFVLTATDLSELRKMYPNAADSKENAKEFFAKTDGIQEADANKTKVAYKGAAETLKSKFANNLPDKTKHMKLGAKLIDGAVAADPDNIEIRMIRLSVQESVPRIVNYRKDKDEDKAYILSHYAKSDDLKDYIKNFIKRSKSFSEAEKAALK